MIKGIGSGASYTPIMKTLSTSPTLLKRIKNVADEQAWKQFYELYAPLILGFARQQGCSETVSYDVLQETMCRLLRYLPRFDYNPKPGKQRQFRSYLLTVVKSRIAVLHKGGAEFISFASDRIAGELELSDDKQTTPGKQEDTLWEQYLFFLAIDRVKQKIEPATWRSFEMYVLDRQSAANVANAMRIKTNLVYQHKSSVTRLLKDEVEKLRREIGE